MTVYQADIEKYLNKTGDFGKYDPRHIEGYMRLEHSTLNGLSTQQFNKEIRIAMDCICYGGVEMAESNAQSFGL